VAANGSFSGKTFKEKCWTMMLCFLRKNLNQIMPEADLFLKQAGMTAHHYLFQAIKSIDQAFGEGYAKANPELVGVHSNLRSRFSQWLGYSRNCVCPKGNCGITQSNIPR